MLWIVGKLSAEWKKQLDNTGYKYGLFIDSRLPKTPSGPHNVYPLNFENSRTLIASIKKLPDTLDVSSLFVAGYEQYVMPAAVLANYFSVPGITIESAEAVTNKLTMRQHFHAYNPAISPKFAPIQTVRDALKFGEEYGYPVVMKPTNLMKSLYVTVSHTPNELLTNYSKTAQGLQDISKRIPTTAASSIIVEEFLSGSMHTVVGFADKDGTIHLMSQIVDCITATDIGVKDSYLFSRQLPTSLNQEDQIKIMEAAESGAKALTLRSSALHIEIMLTKQGAKVIEIGARPGGYRARMYANALGIDLYKASIAAASNSPFDLDTTQDRACAVLELFPAETKKYSSPVGGIAFIRSLSSHVVIREASIGKTIGKASDGYRAALQVTLTAKSQAELQKDIDAIRSQVLLLL